jgi:selenium metabolism protein YedF
MIKKIDARGLACPAPVLQTKKTVEEEETEIIKVIVDNEAARQNVTRFLESRHFEVSAKQVGEDFHLIGKIDRDTPDSAFSEIKEQEKPGIKKIMVIVASNRMGHGDDDLGTKLMISFLKTLKEMGSELWRLVFLNAGVKLTISDSEALPVLKDLEKHGIYILVCGTCLTHFNILDKKEVGETTNMLDIVTAMQLADKVINM